MKAIRERQRTEQSEEDYYELDAMQGEKTIADSIEDSIARFFRYVKENASFFKQSAVAHFISILAGIFAGIFLGKSEELLLLLPGLIMLVPAAIGMRGNIFSSLGSRLGSALHLGSVEKFSIRNFIVKNNLYASFLLSIVFSVLLAVVARVFLIAFGIESITIMSLVVISFIGGIISGVILLFMTFAITFVSFKRGWDPDNITSPIITALGDMFTIPSLLLAAMLVLNYKGFVFFSGLVIFGIFAASLMIVARSKKSIFTKIIIQSSPVLMVGIILDSFSGLILQSNIYSFAMLPILLFLVPGFLEQGGNIGNILASRLSTKLHLGLVKPVFSFQHDVKIEIVNTYVFAFLLFPLLGLLTFTAALLLGIGSITLGSILITTLFAGLILTTVVICIAFFIAIISFKFNLDPDNTTLPIIASSADVVGVISLILVLNMLGII